MAGLSCKDKEALLKYENSSAVERCVKKIKCRKNLGSNVGYIVRHPLSVTFWSFLDHANRHQKTSLSKGMKSKPFIPFLIGAVVNMHSGFYSESLLDLCLCPCWEEDAQDRCWKWREGAWSAFHVQEGAWQGDAHIPPPHWDWRVSPCLQGNSSTESAFGYREDLAFSWTLCAFSALAGTNHLEDPRDVQTTTYSIAVLETGQDFLYIEVI